MSNVPAETPRGPVVPRDPERFRHMAPEPRAVIPPGYSAPLTMRLTRSQANDRPGEIVFVGR